MKVICAGFSKTGTKSMQAALTELGYNVYDFFENYKYLADDWTKILTEGGTTDDFRRMYENVDAVTDVPACYFWDEIHKAFPESKIVMMLRDEEEWANSWRIQSNTIRKPIHVVMWFLSPTFKKFSLFATQLYRAIFGINLNDMKGSIFKPAEFNLCLIKMAYRRHNAHVLQNAPKDKLLVYNVKEGWEPLCNFLGVEVPSTPFPHKNVRATIVKEWMKTESVYVRSKREMYISASMLTLLFAYGACKLYKSSPSTWYQGLFKFVSSLRETLAV